MPSTAIGGGKAQRLRQLPGEARGGKILNIQKTRDLRKSIKKSR